ncbi:MAG: type II TA system antitoxin MqsA family protein [Polyangia bacterium]
MEKEEAMTCSNCGSKMSSRRENFKYTACGLDYVTLVNVEVLRCKDCGECEVVIPKIEELHRVLALIVAQGKSRLRGSEIRFLRKYLGYSGAEAASALSVGPEWMSKWENDKVPISQSAERFLRLMVVNQQPAQFYPLKELLAERADKKPAPIRLDRDSSWKSAG